jgi:molybdenum cofactor cytidylyltransferase
MGKPKQLLAYKGKTLLDHTISQSHASSTQLTVLVLGANADAILESHQHPQLFSVINSDWQQGMSSSIRSGVKAALESDPDIENIIITLADQPFVDAQLIEELISRRDQSGKNIISCSYGGTVGTPSLFSSKYFGELLGLEGQNGAKALITRQLSDLETIPFPLGHIDIDTEEDYNNLINLT